MYNYVACNLKVPSICKNKRDHKAFHINSHAQTTSSNLSDTADIDLNQTIPMEEDDFSDCDENMLIDSAKDAEMQYKAKCNIMFAPNFTNCSNITVNIYNK